MRLAKARAQRNSAASGDGRDLAGALLAWYDRHRRVLPWRAGPGERPDPYRVWLSEIMLQQTTVRVVAPYYARFLERFPDLAALAAADLDDVLKAWAGLGYYTRARNLHACARLLARRHGGVFPITEAELRALPGVGVYTAAAIAAIAFDRPATPVDGNVARVVARLFAVADALPAGKSAIEDLAKRLTPERRAGDFAQAMMDLGATICTPKQPACALCPWIETCRARRAAEPESFPRKARKRTGAVRRGAAFVVLRADGAVLVRTRAPRGLLGGMTEAPTSSWTHDFDETRALDHAPRVAGRAGRWRRLPGVITHSFTHFPLELAVYVAHAPMRTRAPEGMRFLPEAELAGAALPNVMRKVLAHALANFPSPPPCKGEGREGSKARVNGANV